MKSDREPTPAEKSMQFIQEDAEGERRLHPLMRGQAGRHRRNIAMLREYMGGYWSYEGLLRGKKGHAMMAKTEDACRLEFLWRASRTIENLQRQIMERT